METKNDIARHWGRADIYALIVSALEQSGKSLDALTADDLAPIDHFHARGFPATVDLADRLPVAPDHRVLDIGCGLGGPARYFAARFGCAVSGIDLTPAFVDAGNRLTRLLGMEDRVDLAQGDAQRLPYADGEFDGAYAQHVTMNVPDRSRFFAEANRVLKPGGYFGLTEHGLGPVGDPHHPLPWSEDGAGEHLMTPEDTRAHLEAAGFEVLTMEDTGQKYLDAYRGVMALAAEGALPPLGIHLLMGANAREKTANAARNIEERRTHPIQVICCKPV